MPKHAQVDSASSLYLALRLVNFSIFGEFFGDFEFWFAHLIVSSHLSGCVRSPLDGSSCKKVCCSSCTTGMAQYLLHAFAQALEFSRNLENSCWGA
jgi:hypothetical protein